MNSRQEQELENADVSQGQTGDQGSGRVVETPNIYEEGREEHKDESPNQVHGLSLQMGPEEHHNNIQLLSSSDYTQSPSQAVPPVVLPPWEASPLGNATGNRLGLRLNLGSDDTGSVGISSVPTKPDGVAISLQRLDLAHTSAAVDQSYEM